MHDLQGHRLGFEYMPKAVSASKQLAGNLVEADLGRLQDQLPNCLPSVSEERNGAVQGGRKLTRSRYVASMVHTWGTNYKDWSGVAQQMGLWSNNVQRSTGLRGTPKTCITFISTSHQ